MPLHGTLSGSQLLVSSDVQSDFVAIFDNDQASSGHVLKLVTDGNGSATRILEMEDGDDDTLFRARADGRFGFGPAGVASMGAGTFVVGISGGHTADLAISKRFQHLGDSDTYMEFPAVDQISFQAGGVAMLEMKEASSLGQVLFLSGGGGGSPDPADFDDVNFFVSGAIGSRGTSAKGTTSFGGDVAISGSLFAGDGEGAGVAVAKKTGFTFDLATNSSDPTSTETQNVRAGRITFTVNGSISNNASLGFISIVSNKVTENDVIVATAGVTSENRFGVDASATAVYNGGFMIMLANYTGQTLSNDSTFSVNWAAI